MYKNLKWLRILPDRFGKGGTKTGIHTFQGTPVNDTRIVNSFHVYRGRWRRDFPAQSVAGTAFDSGNLSDHAVHGYTFPSVTDPTALPGLTILGHHIGGGVSRYWDFTNNTLRDSHPPNSIPATFLNIGGRCFAADGAREGFIFDDRTPAIHAQANQNLGVMAPAQPLRLSGGVGAQNLSLSTSVYIHDASPYVNTPNPNSQVGTIINTDLVTPFVLDVGDPYYAAVVPMPAAVPAANAVTSNTVPTPFPAAGTLSCVQGASLVTLSVAWPANNQYSGLAVNFNGFSAVISTTGPSILDWDIDGGAVHGTGTLLNTEAVILGVYNGPTVTNIPYTITGCQVVMGANAAVVMGQSPAPLGYAQSTRSSLAQVGLLAKTNAGVGNYRNLGSISLSTPAGVGFVTWAGPQYAYALYDPETEHMSNISPITQVPAPFAPLPPGWSDFQHITPFFEIDPGYLSYASGVDATRFSHIMFFRTLSTPGSSTLYPIGSLQPFVGKVHPGSVSTRGSWNPGLLSGWLGMPTTYTDAGRTTGTPYYWYDDSSDQDLLLSGGFRAPQETNDKPVVALAGGLIQPGKPAYMAYWDGRLWTTCTETPDVINFSCDDAQCPLGVPVESFPPTNFLRLTSEDGRVLGMRKFGEMLVVTTERWAYTIVGNNESNYRLLRISTSMPGVGTYQMDEIASAVEGAPSTIYFLGRDKIVYRWVPGGEPVPISAPVQDIINANLLNTVTAYGVTRIHCLSAWARRLVCLTVKNTLAPLIYDVDNGCWTSNSVEEVALGSDKSPKAYTTVYGLNPPVNELFTMVSTIPAGVIIRSWIRDDGATPPLSNSVLETFPIDFDGKKTRKQIVMVNAHVSAGAAGTWVCSVTPNEGGSHTATMAIYGATAATDKFYSVYTPPTAPVDSATAQDLVVMTAEFNVSGAAIWGYRFIINITCSAAINTELYALDIGYVDIEEPGDGDA